MAERELVLSDTVEMMQSDDYKERFKAEYFQLSIRLAKLREMVEKWDAGTLDFEPTCPREIYDKQLLAMSQYLDVLEERAQIEGVELIAE